MDHDVVLQQLSRRLDRLEVENHRLREELADAREFNEDVAPTVMSRRTWLARGAAATVGAVAGGVALRPHVASATTTDMFTEMAMVAAAETSLTSNVPAPLVTDLFNSAFRAVNSNGTRGTGLLGSATSIGVVGVGNGADSTTGVYGYALSGSNSVGVKGEFNGNVNGNNYAVGVWGNVQGVEQIGVKGYAERGWAGWFESPWADLMLGGDVTRQAPTLDIDRVDYVDRVHYFGEVVAETDHIDSTATLWFCTESGEPGTWRRLAGADSAGAFTLLPTPQRVYDSRLGTLPAIGSKAPILADSERLVDCTVASSGVPMDAVGVLLNVTAVAPAASSGYIAVRSKGTAEPVPPTSNLNFTSSQVVCNAVTSACADGSVLVRAGAGACNVIVDVVGYYR